MKKKLILSNDSVADRACLLIKSIPPNAPIHEVIIREVEKSRSVNQNSLYWQWLTIIANELGNSKDVQHLIYKEKFLIPIYIRDDIEFAKMVEAVKDVRRAKMNRQANELKKVIVRMTSTTTAKVRQMTEYLNDIKVHAAELGISLPMPEGGRV